MNTSLYILLATVVVLGIFFYLLMRSADKHLKSAKSKGKFRKR
ncbi:MAG: hypothetical protein N2489_04245 [Clostridia bacterium]|nr:hypothetical protein [Clostridia bacterium]